MTQKSKVLTIAALVLFSAAPVLFYQYSERLAAAHDPQRCEAEYERDIKQSRYTYSKRGEQLTQLQYCDRLEFEAWCCRYGGILSMVGGLACVYFAVTRSRAA